MHINIYTIINFFLSRNGLKCYRVLIRNGIFIFIIWKFFRSYFYLVTLIFIKLSIWEFNTFLLNWEAGVVMITTNEILRREDFLVWVWQGLDMAMNHFYWRRTQKGGSRFGLGAHIFQHDPLWGVFRFKCYIFLL